MPAPGRPIEPRSGDLAVRVRHPAVPVGGETIEEGERRSECLGAAQPMPKRRHEHRKRMHQVRRDPQQRRPLSGGFADAREVEVLEIADAAVNDLERVRRGLAPEIPAVEQGHRESALGRVPGGGRTADAAAHDDEVELARRAPGGYAAS